jgi:hypothetical protein
MSERSSLFRARVAGRTVPYTVAVVPEISKETW